MAVNTHQMQSRIVARYFEFFQLHFVPTIYLLFEKLYLARPRTYSVSPGWSAMQFAEYSFRQIPYLCPNTNPTIPLSLSLAVTLPYPKPNPKPFWNFGEMEILRDQNTAKWDDYLSSAS